jgi:DNA-binding response OmpR family regulator
MNAPRSCRVLVVEDDPTIAANVATFLEAHASVVDIAHDGAAAMGRLERETFDVVVLDLGLPRASGVQVLDHLRRTLRLPVPVLILTARDELGTRVDLLNAGADDYLVKPFALVELQARIAALHRRASAGVVDAELRAGPLALDLRTREARVGETPVRLMPRAMRLLEVLLRDPGRVVPRAELEAALWHDAPPEGDALRSQVHLLRRALAAAGCDRLETVHGVGWRIRADETPR